MNIINEIHRIKKQKNAVILAHYYQMPEVQDIADFIGDSLALSQKATETEADIIVFCGVLFMAETAKILNKEKKVLLPDLNAGCSLADLCRFKDLLKFKEKNKDYTIVSYINCSAEVKTLSDIICTSSNALKIVKSIDRKRKILFVPDKNLGSYVNNISGRNMMLWNGSCQVHDMLTVESIINLKNKHPEAKIIAHPECKGQILKMADYIGSTSALLKYTIKTKANEFIVATESGIIHQMKKNNPEKNFYIVSIQENCSCNDCPYMKMIDLQKVYSCLIYEKPEIKLNKNIIVKARIPLLKMLEISE